MNTMLRFTLFAGACWLGAAGCHLAAGLDDLAPTQKGGGSAGGEHIWSIALQSNADDQATSVAIAGSDRILWGGYSRSLIDFGGGDVPPAALGDDALVAVRHAADGTPVWARRFGTDGHERVLSLAVFEQTVIAVGSFDADVDFEGSSEPKSSEGEDDIFIAALDLDSGVTDWAQAYGGQGADVAHGVAVDAAGNVIVVGDFRSQVTFGTETADAGLDVAAFVLRLDSAGNLQWARTPGLQVPAAAGSARQATAVAIDMNGNIAVVGSYEGVFPQDGDCNELPATGGGDRNVFIVGLDGDGSCIFARDGGGSGLDEATAVGFDSQGRVIVGGITSGGLDLGCGEAPGGGGQQDVFLAALSPAGDCEWANAYGDEVIEQALSLSVSGEGDIGVAGWFKGSIDFGCGAHPGAGGDSAFLAKFDPGGTCLWSHQLGGGAAQLTGTAFDDSSNVVVTGGFNGTASWGGETFAEVGGLEAVLAKYGP